MAQKHWIRKLIEVAVNPLDDRTITNLLVIASIFLTLVSLHTTIIGLKYYFDWQIFAYLSGLAIQTLLFATSWRIGAALASKFFKFSLLMIYIITMIVSVFFSYAAFLNQIFQDADRNSELAELFQSKSKEVTNSAMDSISRKIETEQNVITGKIQAWASPIIANSEKIKQQAVIKYNRENQTTIALTLKAKDEEDVGGTEVRSNKTRGPIWDGIVKKRNDARIAAAREKGNEESFDIALTKLQTALKKIRSSVANQQDDFPESSELRAGCSKLEFTANEQSQVKETYKCEQADQFIQDLLASTSRYRLLKKAKKECDDAIAKANPMTSSSDIQDAYKQCWFTIDELELQPNQKGNLDESDWRKKSSAIIRWTGGKSHQFRLAIGLLVIYPHPLAVGSLLIAIVVDLLVLLCAFLGARPRSYLDLREPSDLYGSEEQAILTTIFYSNWQAGSEQPAGSNFFLERIKEIRSSVTFDALLAKEGFAGYIEITIEKKFSDIFPLLIALELAEIRSIGEEPNKKTIVALRVRLMLFLADLVATRHQETQIGQAAHELMDELTQAAVPEVAPQPGEAGGPPQPGVNGKPAGSGESS